MTWNLWRRPFSSYVFLWMALGLLSLTILLMAGALTSRERDRWVNHSLQVLQNLERYEASVMSAQVRARDTDLGSAPASDRKTVEADIETARQAVERLSGLTDDNPRQAVRVRVLRSLTEQLAARIHAQRQAPAMIGVPLQSAIEDAPLSETIEEIRKEERELLEKRQRQRSSADNSFWIYTGFAISSNLLIIWWAYTASRRYIQERNRTEFEIRDLNARLAEQVTAIRKLNLSLEDRVAEKTGQLEATVSKLKATNQELERFAYVASHDMQEPLRQVASFNNLLALKYGEQLDETANRYLQFSVAGAKRLQLMLRGLLQYTVTSASAVNPVEVPVQALVQSALEELQGDIQAAGAEVKVKAEEGLAVVGDRDMLRTVLVALISNAVKFRRKDVPPVVEVEFLRQPREWTLTVADNGMGIEEHFIPRMFEMFARFHPVGEYAGAGVGLALSKRIVDCHSGKVTARPNPAGQGTMFHLCIPISMGESKNSLETQRFPY